MSRSAYKRGYDAIDWSKPLPAPVRDKGYVARSSFPTPMVVSDVMDPTEHVDGKFYDSKAAYRRVTRENGYIEVGNDPARLRIPERRKPDKKKRREAVNKAVAQVLGA